MKAYLVLLSLIAVALPLAYSKSSERRLRTFDDDYELQMTQTFPPPEEPYKESKTTVTEQKTSFLDMLKNLSDTVLERVNDFVQGVKGVFGGGRSSSCKEAENREERKQLRLSKKGVEQVNEYEESDEDDE